jgi:hypothetical protein
LCLKFNNPKVVGSLFIKIRAPATNTKADLIVGFFVPVIQHPKFVGSLFTKIRAPAINI